MPLSTPRAAAGISALRPVRAGFLWSAWGEARSEERRLPRPDRPHDSYPLAFMHREGDIVKDGMVAITETDAIEFDKELAHIHSQMLNAVMPAKAAPRGYL